MIPAACPPAKLHDIEHDVIDHHDSAVNDDAESMAPRESRFAGIPVTFIMRNAMSMETGIVVATTSADRTLP